MRIRSIRPEFWSSQDVALMNWPTRLIYIGLWSYVDDNGVGVDNPGHIMTLLFPGDVTADVVLGDNETCPGPGTYQDTPVGLRECYRRVTEALRYLSDRGHITRYEVDGKRFLHIKQWKMHQRIEKPSRARYPLPAPRLTCEDSDPTVGLPEPSRNPPAKLVTGEGEKGRRGEGEKGRRGEEEKGRRKENTSSADADGATRNPDLLINITDTPPAENQTARKQRPADTAPRFTDFWILYPRKIGKQTAQSAYAKAIKKGTDPDNIIASLPPLIDAWAQHEPKYTPHPATWLNRGGWDDDPVPAPIRPRTNGQAARDAVFESWDTQVAAAGGGLR